jgi:cold-inducible RNA-binding protein
MKLFVSGLSYSTTDEGFSQAFAAFGNVVSAKVITDRDSGRSKGFGFVEFASDEEGNAATAGMNGQMLDGRQVRVEVARPMEARPPRTGGSSSYGSSRPPRAGGYGGSSRGGSSYGSDRDGGNSEYGPRSSY